MRESSRTRQQRLRHGCLLRRPASCGERGAQLHTRPRVGTNQTAYPHPHTEHRAHLHAFRPTKTPTGPHWALCFFFLVLVLVGWVGLGQWYNKKKQTEKKQQQQQKKKIRAANGAGGFMSASRIGRGVAAARRDGARARAGGAAAAAGCSDATETRRPGPSAP